MDPLELLEFSAELEAGSRLQSSPTRRDTQARIASSARPPRSARSASSRASRPPRWSSSVAVVDTAKLLPTPRDLGLMQISRILLGAEILEDWFGRCASSRSNAWRNGIGIPGYKLVEKDSRRKFNGDEDELVSEFGLLYDIAEDEIRPRKLATITDIERKLAARVKDKDELRKAKEAFSLKYTIKESSGVRIAPASDKRPAVNAVATDYASVNLPAA